MTIDGGCFCGAIRYRIETDDYRVGDCHCTMCRRTSAAPFVTWIIVPTESFSMSGEAPHVLQSSKNGTRRFCGSCGTPLVFNDSERPHDTDVTVCSLDDPERFPPTKAVHEDTRLSWVSGHVVSAPST